MIIYYIIIKTQIYKEKNGNQLQYCVVTGLTYYKFITINNITLIKKINKFLQFIYL